ncbi:M23 family metallopeptidase [Desulfolutivibrio sulfoxidireducens]|uniref:M23 family metallopeptidase n=1 Tax=Desulfolutivibrio sulfoxidireducens TaxID=2773299 RepID=UPI00159DBA6F|nr:M23 family metallopeptidase [Desulfolutivibrio sulfoxidireducens]QLA18209.1 peptidoglycan DD-metalloendopeptidase family protein [Desulfolutivibrio sulfoxidireducens]
MKRLVLFAASVAFALLLSAATALGLELRAPLDCQPGRDCFIQNYVDLDPGPGAADYQCGPLSYDGHKGTDFRIRSDQMPRGVPVLAAAAGVVLAVRDGMPDVSVADTGPEAVRNREAGNSVVLEHEGGYVTQYAHLRSGSVLVKPGDRVAAGQPLGLVGLSGLTEFPHLHFETRQDGHPVCPFAGPQAAPGCGNHGASLWEPTAMQSLVYLPSMVWAAGFAPEPLRGSGEPQNVGLPSTAQAAVFWAVFVGVRRGDVLRLRLTAPDGSVLAQSDVPVVANQAQRMQFVGRRRSGAAWPAGQYTGTAELLRPGEAATVTGPARLEASTQVP